VDTENSTSDSAAGGPVYSSDLPVFVIIVKIVMNEGWNNNSNLMTERERKETGGRKGGGRGRG